MKENPVLAAMEVYRRLHPHRSDEIDEAFERYDPDSEAVSRPPARDGGPESAAASEQTTLEVEADGPA